MAYLTLSDGTVYEGTGFGYEGDAVGEVIFNTGMTGYQEILTDPSYYGHIVNMTYPLIGNYGVNKYDSESDSAKVKGLVVRDYCDVPSNWQSEGTLDGYLKANKIAAIHSIDTRALTRKIRNKGVMAGIISQKLPTAEQMLEIRSYKIENPVKEVTCKEAYDIPGSGELKAAVIDYGANTKLFNDLSKLGISLRIFPASVKAETVLEYNPDGIILTNGPGDPKDNAAEIEEIKKLLGKKPILGVCLGHQLLALASGAETKKLLYGHRGSNYPVRDTESGRVYITHQNHGYTVDMKSVNGRAKVTHINWNDRTVEGIDYGDGLSFSVQFYPESRSGAKDTGYILDRFYQLMTNNKQEG